MKRILAIGLVAVAGFAAIAATCVVTNETMTEIDGRDVFAGEMQNDSGVDILQHKFRVAFLNSNGAVVESRLVDGCLRSVQDGQSNFFSLRSNLAPSTTAIGLARMANLAEDPDFTVGEVEEGDILISDVTAVRTAGSLVVEGMITNEDDDTLEDPVVCVVVWGENGRVITTAKDDDIADLDEAASEEFSVTIAVPDDDDFSEHVDVWADGLEDDVPVEPGSEVNVDVTTVDTPTPSPTNTPEPTATPTEAP
jgi:hypothetical protein